MANWNAEDFEAEIARKLEAEHKRRAEQENTLPAAEPAPAAVEEVPSAAEEEMPPVEVSSVEEEPAEEVPSVAPEKRDGQYSEELSAMMQEEDERLRLREESSSGRERRMVRENPLPPLARLILTILLLACGMAGIYIMTAVDYQSLLLDPLCFTESAVCLLTALGLNTSLIQSRGGKCLLMKAATLALLLFYCVYALHVLSMTDVLRSGLGHVDWLTVAREGLDFNVAADYLRMGRRGLLECAVFVMPFAFFVLLLVRPMRNVGVFYPCMAVLLLAAGTLRVITGTGKISLLQSVVGLAGSSVSYALFLFPPLQTLMRRTGLIGWERTIDEE